MVVTFSVPQCVPKARPRFNGHAYTPRRTVEAERAVRVAYEGASLRSHGSVVKAPKGVPVSITVAVRKGAPKKRPRGLLRAIWDGVGAWPFTTPPDFDNLAKTCCDALNGVAWEDDAQITEAHVFKLPRRRGTQDATFVCVAWNDTKDAKEE